MKIDLYKPNVIFTMKLLFSYSSQCSNQKQCKNTDSHSSTKIIVRKYYCQRVQLMEHFQQKKGSTSISPETVQIVKDFFTNDEFTRIMPGKKRLYYSSWRWSQIKRAEMTYAKHSERNL